MPLFPTPYICFGRGERLESKLRVEVLKYLIFRPASLLPQAASGHLGWLRGAIGAGLGICVSGLLTLVLMGGGGNGLPFLFAPLGASAVLIFAVPASPLAQPWSVIGGDLISATIGLAIGHWLGAPVLSAGLAVGIAIAVMSVARCLHPPGGACALLCALGASGAEAWGIDYLVPIAINVFALASTGWLYNNLTGHPWPHRVKVPQSPASTAADWTQEDLEAVLAEWNEVVDVDVNELEAIYQSLQRRAKARKNQRA